MVNAEFRLFSNQQLSSYKCVEEAFFPITLHILPHPYSSQSLMFLPLSQLCPLLSSYLLTSHSRPSLSSRLSPLSPPLTPPLPNPPHPQSRSASVLSIFPGCGCDVSAVTLISSGDVSVLSVLLQARQHLPSFLTWHVFTLISHQPLFSLLALFAVLTPPIVSSCGCVCSPP